MDTPLHPSLSKSSGPNLLRKTPPWTPGCDLEAPCGGSASCSWFCVGGIYCPGGLTAPQVGLEKSTPRGWRWQMEKSTNNMQVKILYALLGLCYISHGGGWYVVWTRGWRHSINLHQHLVKTFVVFGGVVASLRHLLSGLALFQRFSNSEILAGSFSTLGRDTARWSACWFLGFGGDLEERLQQIANGSEPISHYEAWQIGPDDVSAICIDNRLWKSSNIWKHVMRTVGT